MVMNHGFMDITLKVMKLPNSPDKRKQKNLSKIKTMLITVFNYKQIFLTCISWIFSSWHTNKELKFCRVWKTWFIIKGLCRMRVESGSILLRQCFCWITCPVVLDKCYIPQMRQLSYTPDNATYELFLWPPPNCLKTFQIMLSRQNIQSGSCSLLQKVTSKHAGSSRKAMD